MLIQYLLSESVWLESSVGWLKIDVELESRELCLCCMSNIERLAIIGSPID